MAETEEQRRKTRREVDLPNAVRLITEEGDCLANIRDLGPDGMGIEYFDFFCSLDLSPGTELSVQLVPARTGRETRRGSESNASRMDQRPDAVHVTNVDSSDRESEEPPFPEIRARVLWQHLNRLGIEFCDDSAKPVIKALFEDQ